MPEVIFNGPAGRLEGRYTHSKIPNAPIVLLMHPHPQHGGTMNNKVLYAMHKTFVEQGFSTLRFNFRGVGKSTGTYDKGIGELSDAAASLDWLQSYNPNPSACWVAGFSFGAWITMQLLMRRPEINTFITIAPPANMFDFSFLAPCPTSGLILQGTKDAVVPQEASQELSDRLSNQRGIQMDYRTIEGANHFFDDQQKELRQEMAAYITSRMKEILQSAA